MHSSARRLLVRAQYLPLALAAVYALILLVFTVPAVQDEFVFLQRLRLPLAAKYDNPEHYGLAPYKTRNLRIETPDGEVLGLWHILPQSVYIAQDPFPPSMRPRDSFFDKAFGSRPTILYFHGNAATRAASHRVRTYIEMSSRLDVNVIAVDYRGFGDSTGTPSQQGLVIDARTVWDWVQARVERASIKPADQQIMLVGHSLGTGVASALAAELADGGLHPRAIALIAPFTSIPDLLSSLWLFGIIPLLTPLKAIPGAIDYFKTHVVQRFNSSEALSRTTSPMLLLHSFDDPIIPHYHSVNLFQQLNSPNGTQLESSIRDFSYPGWGRVTYAEVADREVVFWEGESGGHNSLGHSEGTMDLMAWIGKL
ncbi:uncharacterized protein EHS24_008772 [Apiotrichum porosum]|uniref:Alpha/beta hydrolase fold-3 domain-containing protein n=1 Tax=Apiotrichum porosum TaxID=105984 RepID=A0A427XR43_9TREE|nr:uncharacterized protein EHS24_008772 [Apiotrichum porosum]RSH81329.1 hypothetical protein EHS24_008772 [Apiotrichum porosum]